MGGDGNRIWGKEFEIALSYVEWYDIVPNTIVWYVRFDANLGNFISHLPI